MAAKRVPASEMAKTTEPIKQIKKIPGSATGALPKPSSSMTSSNPRQKAHDAAVKAEAAYNKMIESGKVTPKNVDKVKNDIAKKYGSWPNGKTN